MQIKTIQGYTEIALIEGCCNGNRKCQEVLYFAYSKKMLGIAMRYVTSYEEAEDIVMEGFVKIFKNIEKYRSDGSFEGWMRRIFVNTAIEHYRKNTQMYALIDIEACCEPVFEETALEHLQKEDLLAMIHTLSAGYRTVFNLHVIEGYTHKEIGELLGISAGTSKSQFMRARHILQKKIVQSMQLPKQESST